MAAVGSILTGWGTNVLYLIDNDKQKDGEKSLKQALCGDEKDGRVIYVSKKQGATVDLLSTPDFEKYVLKNEETDSQTSMNSERLKKSNKDKVLLARQFLQSVRSESSQPTVSIDSSSQKKIQKIFTNLCTQMHKCYPNRFPN